MSNIIDFLARVGADASLRHASTDAIGEAIATASLDEALGHSLATGDIEALRSQLAPAVFCGIQLKTDEDEEPEETEKDEAEISNLALRRRA